jgi:hypothetical protein
VLEQHASEADEVGGGVARGSHRGDLNAKDATDAKENLMLNGGVPLRPLRPWR